MESEGVKRIAAERQRQIQEEGYDVEHDRDHANGELALAASLYASPEKLYRFRAMHDPHVIQLKGDGTTISQATLTVDCARQVAEDPWPWDSRYDKRAKHSRIRRLEIAGALIAAELDRLLEKESHG